MAEWQEKLRKLDKLRKDSLITDEEYDKEKALLMPSEMKKGLLDRLGEKKKNLICAWWVYRSSGWKKKNLICAWWVNPNFLCPC